MHISKATPSQRLCIPSLPLLYPSSSCQFGPERVEYADGSAIEFSWPALLMSGYVYGQRLSNYRGTVTLRDITNKLQFASLSHLSLRSHFSSSRLDINIEFAPKGFVGTVLSWFGKKKETRPGDFFTGTVCSHSTSPVSLEYILCCYPQLF